MEQMQVRKEPAKLMMKFVLTMLDEPVEITTAAPGIGMFPDLTTP